MGKKTLTLEDKERIVELRDKGLKFREIASLLRGESKNISYQGVHKAYKVYVKSKRYQNSRTEV